jgi:hypothetical protein
VDQSRAQRAEPRSSHSVGSKLAAEAPAESMIRGRCDKRQSRWLRTADGLLCLGTDGCRGRQRTPRELE